MSRPPCICGAYAHSNGACLDAGPVKLRYDGRYEFVHGENRQWTIVSTFIDRDGANRKGSSFFLETLKDIGAI